jgi:tetratricopeptide (TPR) repeat protein
VLGDRREQKAELLADRSQAYVAMSALDEARADATAAVEADPLWPEGYEHKARTFMALGRFEDAQEVRHFPGV